jgi:hypothetical protein
MIKINPQIIYMIFIFIILICSFYLVINNFGISNIKLSSDTNISNITNMEKTISELKNQLSNIKSEMSNSNSEPEINFNTNSTGQGGLGGPGGPGGQVRPGGLTGPSAKPPPIIFDPIANYDQAKLLDPLVDPRGRTSADQIPAPQVAAQLNFPTQGVLDRYHRVGLLIAIDTPYDNEGGKGKRPRRRHARKRVDRYPDAASDNLSDNSSNSSTGSTGSNKSGNYRGVEFSGGNNGSFESFGNYMDEGPNGILELIGKKITDNWYKYFTSISKGNKIIKIVVNNRNRRELYSGDEVYIQELNRWYQVQMDEMDMIEYNPYMF